MTCPSGLAKHSPHYTVSAGEKKSRKSDMQEDFLLGEVWRLLVVTPKMDKSVIQSIPMLQEYFVSES